MKEDLFAHKSKSWDMNSKRVQNAQSIAETIVQNIPLHEDMHLLDLGAGTGLLSYFLAQKVGTITALDNSPSMLKMFHEKRSELQCDTDHIEADFMKHDFDKQYDGVVSSMTIHHIEDIPALFHKLYTILIPGGFIALADLEKEDGSFHSDNTGVFHYGFETEKLAEMAKEAGFEDVAVHHAGSIRKPHREFGVFLLTGRRT